MPERVSKHVLGENARSELAEIIKQEGYDNPEVAQHYYELYGRDGLEPKISRYFEQVLDKALPQEGVTVDSEEKQLSDCEVLDLGSGPGVMSEILHDKFGQVIAVDKAQAMVDFINQEHPLKGEIDARQGDFADRLPLEDDSVETAISFNFIDEIQPEDEDVFLEEIARVVKPGGFALLNQVVNSDNLAMQKKFSKERQKEIERNDPNIPRQYVFLSSSLEDRLKNLLAEKGIGVQVEIFDDTYDYRYCIAKINFNKIDKENEV